MQTKKGLYPFQVRRKKNRKKNVVIVFLIITCIFLLGYLAIQLLGLSVGTIILPPSPSFFRRRRKLLINKRRNSDPTSAKADFDITAPRQTEKTATELCSFSIIWWSFLGLVCFFEVDGTWGPDGGVSRRMVNNNHNNYNNNNKTHDLIIEFSFKG